MPQQIQIRWNSGSDEDYEASMEALRAYSPAPDIAASVRMKGTMSQQAVRDIVDLAGMFGLELQVTLTASWLDEDEVHQLRLFPAPVPEPAPDVLDEANAVLDVFGQEGM